MLYEVITASPLPGSAHGSQPFAQGRARGPSAFATAAAWVPENAPEMRAAIQREGAAALV